MAMLKKHVILVLMTAVLGAVYAVYFSGWFTRAPVAVSARPRLERQSGQKKPRVSVSFSFDTSCRLTEVKVVPLAELETNKYARAVWHLVADESSPAVKGIVYGDRIKGMKPKIPKMRAEPLEPGCKYRLLVEAEQQRGQTDFQIPGLLSSL